MMVFQYGAEPGMYRKQNKRIDAGSIALKRPLCDVSFSGALP